MRRGCAVACLAMVSSRTPSRPLAVTRSVSTVSGFRKNEAPVKSSMTAFASLAEHLFVLACALDQRALAGERQHVVIKGDLNGLGVHSRQLDK